MKNLKQIIAISFASLALGSCQTRDVAPTQPAQDADVALAARLVASHAPPSANRVRLRLSLGGTLGLWQDSAYRSGTAITLGRVLRGSSIVLDVRAYSLGTTSDTLWKWFARVSEKADSALALQILEAKIDTIPTSKGLLPTATGAKAVTLPAGSRYTLDGTVPDSFGIISTGSGITVPAGKTLRARIRIAIPGTTDTLLGDTLRFTVPDTTTIPPDPVVPPASPSMTRDGKSLPSQLGVGDSILIKAETGSKLAYTTDSTAPKCANLLEKNEHTLKIGTDLAGKTLILKAISCRDTSMSTVERKEIKIAKVGETPRQEIGIPSGFDSSEGTGKKGWKDSVTLSLPSAKSTVVWTLVVKTISSTIDASTWNALRIPNATSNSGTGNVLKVDSSLLKDIHATDSVATVLAVAVMSDSSGAVQDTAWLRWTIQVPYTRPKPVAPKAPSMSVNEASLPGQLAIGASILIKADSAATLAYTTDSSNPSCSMASGNNATFKVESLLAGKTLIIKALSCRDSLSSSVARSAVQIAKLDEKVKEQIIVPAQYDSANPTANMLWTENVSLSIPSKATLVWKLQVLPSAKVVDASSWSALGVPDTVSKTGAGNIVNVSKEFLSSLPAWDSVARVIAVVVLYDSTKAAIDTARLRWSIVVPVTPLPRLAVSRFPDKLVFSWPVTASTSDARVWYLIGKDTTKVSSYEKGLATDSFAVQASNGTRVRVGVVSVSSVTERASELAIFDTVALLAPRKPGFTISNTDTVEGKVEIELDSATRAEKNTTWMAGYAANETGDVTAYDVGFTDGKCVINVNGGTRDFGVRATRDDMMADSVTRLAVKRTKGLAPEPVLGLKVSRKDSSTVVWSWTRSGTREYRVLLRRDGTMQNHFDTVDCLDADKKNLGNVDSFKVPGLANGATVSLAVVALAGTDSAAGNAEPVFSTATTLTPPSTPVFTVINSNTATGEVRVAITSLLAGATNWYVGFDSTGGDKFAESRTASSTFTKAYSVNGTVNVQVKAERDGYTKITRKSLEVKNTNLVAPKPPTGLTWTRTTDSVTLRWTTFSTHQYRLFWDISSSTADIDTSVISTNKVLNPANPFTVLTSPGQRVRIALQTVKGGTDSTNPSSLVYASETALAPVDPVGTITAKLTSPDTRTVMFSWNKVVGAVKYKFSSTTETGVVKETTSNSVSFTFLPGTLDVSFSIQAVNADGVISSASTSTLHIPQNRGNTNLESWDIRTNGMELFIGGKASTTITGKAPDSVNISVWPRATGTNQWKIAYPELAQFAETVLLDSVQMRSAAGNGLIFAQFRWTSGNLKGDTTEYDSVFFNTYASAVPEAIFQIENGNMMLQISNFTAATARPSGWNLAVFAKYGESWIDIVNNADKSTYPDITEGIGGMGTYPIGATQLKIYSYSGLNTSVTRIGSIGYETMVVHEGHQYPVVTFGAKRWITRPMNTTTTANLCADKSTSADCGTSGRLYTWLEATKLSAIPDTGNNLVQGVCPTGWRIPYSSDFVDLANAVEPGWKWVAPESGPFPETYAKLLQARFEFRGYSKDNPNNAWSAPAMWSATTGTNGNLQYQDLWFIHDWSGYGDIFSAFAREPTSQQIALAFCIEQ